MRKVIASMNITLDGFIAGRQGELDWHFNYWNEEMARYASEQLSRADTILLGRKTYDAMAAYWPSSALDLTCTREDIAFADMMNHYRKVVFSHTLKKTNWANSVLVQGNLRKQVTELKLQPGKDMIIYGSNSIVSALTRMGMIDEYVLWLHPILLGAGQRIFEDLDKNLLLEMYATRVFNTGVIVFNYRNNDLIHQKEKMEHGKIYVEK